MIVSRPAVFLAVAVVIAAAVAGCGGSKPAVPAASTASTVAGSTAAPPASTASSNASDAAAPGPLIGEAAQTAAGDIPDNQVFLTFRNGRAGYSIKYPEGWARRGAAASVTFRDKNNLVRVSVGSASAVTVASVLARMRSLAAKTPSLRLRGTELVDVGGRRVVRSVYSTRSAANPVTGRSVTLLVDRYYLPGRGGVAVVDLGTPVGVDNVDAYRLMIESFRWQ